MRGRPQHPQSPKGEHDVSAYRQDMEWASFYYGQLKVSIKIASAMISASEPKRGKATKDPEDEAS